MLNGNIAVVFGGVSNENEISVITGTMAVNILKNGGESVLPVYISLEGKFYCDEKLALIEAYSAGNFADCTRCIVADGGIYLLNKKGKTKKFIPVTAAVNCCHGGIGEGGALSGLFCFAGIPLVGADMFASSAFMDKYHTKQVLAALSVPALPYFTIRSLKDITAAIEEISFPMIVKPASLGSSIGVSAVKDERELNSAAGVALAYDGKAICEPYLKDRREINVAVYFADGGAVVSEPEEVFSSNLLMTFDDKYSGGGTSRVPADLPHSMAQRIQDLAKKVYLETGMRGIARFDFLLAGDEVYLSEVNTVPGSLAYYLFVSKFKDFYPVLTSLIDQAIADYNAAKSKRVISTGILRNIKKGTKGCKS